MVKSSNYKYIGAKTENKKFGFGLQIWPDNSMFVGNFSDGKAYGYCFFKNKFGSVFKGINVYLYYTETLISLGLLSFSYIFRLP